MATIETTVSVNAAFLREIKEDNVRLRELLAEIRPEAEALPVVHGHHRDFVGRLVALRDQLALHFALEEAFGYLDDVVADAPRLNQRASELRAEHGDLFVRMSGLVELAEQLLYEKPTRRLRRTLSERFVQFDRDLQAHESHEGALILDALDDDIGVGD